MLFLERPTGRGARVTEPPFEVGFDTTTAQRSRKRHAPSGCCRDKPARSPRGGGARRAPAGIPLGVQVIGSRYREDLCLDAAEVIEARHGLPTPIDPVP